MTGSTFADTLTGTSTANSILGGSGNDTILADNGNDTVNGGFGTDSMTGGDGNDSMDGGASNDTILGGAGTDTITGGSGQDSMTGGAAADTFDFAPGDSGTPSATVFDVITDFNTGGSDIIDYSAALAVVVDGAAAAGNAAVDAEGLATFDAADDTLAEQIAAVADSIAGGAAGTFAFWPNGADTYLYISDGVAGISATDVLIQMADIATLTNSTLNGGDLTLA